MRNFLHPKPMKSDATPVFYRDRVVDKLIRIFMLYGRKELSRKLVYDALELVKRYQFKKWLDAKTDDERSAIILDPFVIANKAIFNCRPLMKLKPLQRGFDLFFILNICYRGSSRFVLSPQLGNVYSAISVAGILCTKLPRIAVF